MQRLLIVWTIIHYLCCLTTGNNRLYTKGIGIFDFKVGYQYIYRWEVVHGFSETHSSDNETSENNKDSNHSRMIKGFAKIVSGPECDMRLKMYSVEEFSPTEGSSEYEKHSVKFCLENGRLKSIEYSQDEKNHSINLKKSLLFQLQMSTETYGLPLRTIENKKFITLQHFAGWRCEHFSRRYIRHPISEVRLSLREKSIQVSNKVIKCVQVYETDYLGTCLTEYIPENITSQSITMVKKRNSETCKDNIPTSNSPGNSVEAKQHFLVGGRSVYLNTELTCELTYQPQKSLDSVHCREISATQTWLEAFSIKPITFSVHTQLTLIEMSENRDVLPLFESISKKDFEILEDNEGNQVQEPNHFSMEETIKNQSFLMMVVNSPDRLNNFIKQLQRLTYEELVETYSAWEQLDQSTDIIEFLQSIIAEIQTESSIRFVIKYLIKSKSLSEQLKWISSLGVVQNPTYQLINEMKDLLTNSLYNDTVYFVSLHMRRFCERNPSCIKYGVIKNMIDVIENSLNSSDLTKSLRSLEALSNIGPFLPTAKVISIIRKKLSDHENRLDYNFRILTAQIVYHFKCDENIDILLWTIISNASQSNELRIAVFNSYIRCLDDVKMENILLLLSRSLHNQIRSYIISKLTCLLTTKDSNKWHLRSIVHEYGERIRRFDEDKGLLLGIQNSIYYESLQKTKYGYFLIESSLIYEAYSVMPIAFSAKIQYQTIDIMKDIIHVYYRCGSETIFQRAVIKLIKLIAFYIPSMKQYTERAEKEMQPSVSYDAIFIKWSDDTTYNLLNLSYQMRKWFTLDRDKLDYSFKVNKARILSESKMSYALLSGFHVEWKRTTVSYFNSYIQGKYTQNPYLFSIIIKQSSKLYTSQSIRLVNGIYEQFGFQSNQQIDINLHLNDSVKLIPNCHNLLFETYSNPWPNNVDLFKYTRKDYVCENGRCGFSFSEKKDFHPSESDFRKAVTLKPFNGFHINIFKLCNYASTDPVTQVFHLKMVEMKGLLTKLHYRLDNISYRNNEQRIFHFVFGQSSFPFQDDSEANAKFMIIHLVMNRQENLLQHTELNFSTLWGNSYQFQINISDGGSMQAKGYRNQNKIILANGTINSQENKMGIIAQIFFFSGNINLRNKNSTVSPLLKVTNQVDYWPFQLNWMNNTRTYKNLKTSTINSLNTSACLNVSDLFKANWEFHLSSLEYSYPSIFYIEVVFNDILFQRFRSYQDVIQWNENLSAKETNTYKDEGDQNITFEMKLKSSQPLSNLKCSINIFKTKEFLVPVHRKPSKLQINIGFMHLNNQKQHEMNISLLSIYEINRKQIRNITTVFTFSIPHEEIHFSLDNQLDWKLSAFGALTKFDSLTKIQLLPMNQSVKLMLMYSSEEQLLSYVLMQYDDPHFQNVYSLKSWLQPWRNLYEFTFQWPKLHTVHVLTIYDFTPVDVYTGLTVDHLVYFNHIKYLKIKNQLMYKLDEHKLLILHQTEALNATNNATNNISDNTNNDISEMKNTRLISKFELIFQLYPEMKFTPFHIKFIGAAKIHLFLPTYKINKESEGKLKIDVTKFKGESILKLFDIQLYNQSKFLIEWSSNFKFSHKWLFNTNLKLITQSGEENNLTFSWKSLNKSTFVVLNCLILSLGNFVCHYKHRWDTIYHFGGSNMISIQSYVPNEWLSGFYLNANYALNLNSNQKLIEISAEYSTSNSMGPGSPVRARVFFKHGEMYEFGNLEFGLDSQLMGHHFGYEMVNAMAEYEFSPPHSENQIRFISRAIAGYRLYEGRGTKGYQGELFIVQNKEDNKLNILLRFGRPGLIHQNKFEYSQTLEKMYANLQISTVFSGKSYLEGKVKLQHDKTSSIPTFSNITMFSPCLPLMFNFYYHLERNISVLVINENLLISINRSSNPFYLNQTFEFKNKSIKPLNIYHDMRFQCDTNKGENHLASLSYTSKQSDKEIHKKLSAQWNSTVYALAMLSNTSNEFRVHYHFIDKLWNNVINGNLSVITKSEPGNSINLYYMNGNFVLPYYDINYIVKNVTVLFHDQINKKTVFHYVIVCKDQPSNYCYSSEQTLKFFANSTSYEVYNRISYQDLDVLKIYFQSKTFEIIDIQITVIPLEFNNLKIIDLHMKNELTLQNYSLYFNGSIEIQPYLPKISALLKVSSSGEYFIDEIRTCSSPFEFYFKLINKNIDSKWRKLDLIYIHFVNECSIEDSKFSIEIITPGFVLPYSTYSNGEIKRNIYNEQNVNNLIEFKQGGNSDEAVTSKIAVLQSEHKLSITFDINNKLTVLLNIQKSENNSGGLSSYHMMNFSIFSDADRLGNFLQTIEILEFDRQKSRRILNFLETCQVKYNVSIYLLHLIKQNNVSLMLFQLNLTSSLPLLTENKIDEIDVTYENERKSSSHLILFDCYIKKIKAIHHKSYFTVSTQMPFLKAEMYINKLLGFKQNQNWLIEVTNDYHQFRFCILFNQDHIIMISYNFIDFTLVIIIEKIVHLTTNLLNFISKLSQYTNSYNHKQINNNQVVTKQPNVNSDCSLQIVIETSNLFNLTFKLQLYKQVGIMQIQRILSTNLNLSSKLSSISSTRCVFILKQNISQEQLVYNLIYQGYVENFLNDSHMQINFSSETNNRVDRNITTTTTTTNVQINTNIVFHSEMNAKLLFISELHGPLTVEFHVFETKEEIGKPVFYTYAIYDAFNQDKNMYSFNMGTRRRSINSTVFNSHQKRHIDVLLYLDSLSSVCAFCIQYWSEDHKRSLSIKTPYRQLLYAVEDNQSNNGNNVYGNKTLKLKSIELLNSKAPKDTETELTIYENHFPPSEYGAGEKLEYVGFYLKSNILKQRFFSFLSEINRDEEKVHLTVTINHEQQTNKKNADHQLIFIWPYTWKRKNIYPSLFIKTVDSFVNLTGKYVHQPGILNASLQIETNDQAAYWKLYWERWYFIRIMQIDKHMELNYKLVYNDNVAENNNIIQITCQLSNLEDSLNFSHMTSMSYRNNDKNVNNGNLFIVNSVVECSKQNTGIQAQLNTDYSTFIQVTTRDKSTNDDYLNCRLLASLDRSNTFNLFSYLRPELSEDILMCANELPKYLYSLARHPLLETFQHTQTLFMSFAKNVRNSLDESKLAQLTDTFWIDFEYFHEVIKDWIENDHFFRRILNATLTEKTVKVNFNFTKLNFWQKLRELNMHFTNISSSNFAIAKYLKDIDQHIKVNIRWYSNETFRKLISNINPLLNNSVDVFLHKSEELYRDSIKGIKLGFTGFNLLWHHVMKISEFWLELPTYIYDDHNSNTLEDDEKNATKLKSIAKYSMAVNEYFKYAFKNISGLFGCFEETNSTKGVCGENGKSKLWWGVDFIYQRLHKYIQMIKTEQIEESCRLLFNPNFRNLTSYINGNQYYFKMHLPQLLQIFVRYLQNFWPYYLQSFEEQSRMKCQASYATTETAESS